MRKKNILLIVTDQHRADVLRCYGNDHCYTPNLHALAEEGMVFERAYCTTPICTPARASMQTGLYPSRHGMQTNICTPGCMFHELPDYAELLGRKFQSYGYHTAYTGKWHLGFGPNAGELPEFKKHLGEYPLLWEPLSLGALPSNRGFEWADDFPGHGGGGENYPQFRDYLEENSLDYKLDNQARQIGRAATLASGAESSVSRFLADRALSCITDCSASEKPFFLSLHFWGPHEPYYVPQSFLDLYDPGSIPLWDGMLEEPNPSPRIHAFMRKVKHLDEASLRHYLHHYYAFVTHIDEEIGRLIRRLKELGIYENTDIIFTADHGESLGSHHGMADKGLSMFEETVRVPLIVKASGCVGGRSDAFINTTDLYATLLDMASPDGISRAGQGRSFCPILYGSPHGDWPDHVVVESSGIGHCLHSQRMIRDASWKYVFHVGDIDELYNMEKDPYEGENLINNPAAATHLKRMQQRLLEWMEENADPLLKHIRSKF